MLDLRADTFSFPAGVQIALALVGVLGTILSVAGAILTIRLSPRRANESPQVGRPLHPIRLWRPSQFALALGHLQRFRERLLEDAFSKGTERGHVTESDLLRWIIQLGLTCAAHMVPQSLGKANLFRVSRLEANSDGHTTAITLYSSEFVGVFSVNQLTNLINPRELRHLRFSERQHVDEFPAALQCLVDGLPTMQSLRRRRASFDEPERSLGATHILAIPLFTGLHSIQEQDQVVSITVDLRYSRIGGWILDRRNLYKTNVFRRAARLKELLIEIPQLRDPRFLPLSDRNSPSASGADSTETAL